MAKSERQRQKKADAKKRREQKRKAKDAKRSQVHDTLANFRKKAPMLKRLLRQRGCDWKFYDFLDSNVDAFNREVRQASKDCPSLLAVHEVDDEDYFATDHGPLLEKLGLSGLKQVLFIGTDVGEDYGASDRKSNINGMTVAFRDEAGEFKTLVLIRRKVPDVSNTESKYVFKLIALFHEIGHVKDWEQGIHLKEGKVSILDAEVYANRYALQRLMDGDYRGALMMLLPAFEKLQDGKDYRKEVADRIVGTDLFGKCQECANISWSDQLDAEDTSEDELLRAAGSVSELAKFSQDT